MSYPLEIRRAIDALEREAAEHWTRAETLAGRIDRARRHLHYIRAEEMRRRAAFARERARHLQRAADELSKYHDERNEK